jgi:NAD(P)-dependent dehydrogenase (short-subunit alcohol dehydrogenase family)
MNTKKTILITGCSTGIGYDAALTLHRRGYQVYATARKQEDVARLTELGLVSFQLDLADEKSIATAVNQVFEHSGGELFALFNNGAYGQPGALEDLPTDVLREQFETNVFGWHSLTRKIIPVMLKQGYGRVIQNSSILGLVSMPYRGAYNASKYAIEGLTDTLRLEFMDTNIHFSLIEPGPIESQFRKNARDKFKQHIDMEQSRHSASYRKQLDRLGKDIANKFTLPPSAVTRCVIHALESKRPKNHYYVTTPTYIFAILKRLLPSSWLDKLLVKG